MNKIETMKCNFSKTLWKEKMIYIALIANNFLREIVWVNNSLFHYVGSIVQHEGDIDKEFVHKIRVRWLR